jgi:hypothetical protein
MPRYDDDVFGEDGLLKDGKRMRIPLTMMDSLSRAVHGHYADDAQPAHLVDSYGTTDGLNRPGYRYLTAGSKTKDHAVQVTRETERRAARDAAVQELVDAWKTPGSDREIARVHDTGNPVADAYADSVLDLTTAWQR